MGKSPRIQAALTYQWLKKLLECLKELLISYRKQNCPIFRVCKILRWVSLAEENIKQKSNTFLAIISMYSPYIILSIFTVLSDVSECGLSEHEDMQLRLANSAALESPQCQGQTKFGSRIASELELNPRVRCRFQRFTKATLLLSRPASTLSLWSHILPPHLPRPIKNLLESFFQSPCLCSLTHPPFLFT